MKSEAENSIESLSNSIFARLKRHEITFERRLRNLQQDICRSAKNQDFELQNVINLSFEIWLLNFGLKISGSHVENRITHKA